MNLHRLIFQKLFSFFIIFFYLPLVCSVEKSISVNYAQIPPKIDGRLDDKSWEEGIWFTDFRILGSDSKLAEKQTEFQLLYDENYLYLGARMHEPKPGTLKIKEYRRDGVIHRDDSFEFMIDPYGDKFKYYHFITNAIDIQYDAFRTYNGKLVFENWDCDWKVATKIGPKEWTLEMSIPFAQLDLNTQSLETWNFNACRQSWTEKRELSSFNLVKKTFHEPENFLPLVFDNHNFDKYFWKIEGPYECYLENVNSNWILNGKISIANLASPINDIKILFKQVTPKSSSVVGKIIDVVKEETQDEEKEYSFSFPIQKESPLLFETLLVNAKDESELLKVVRKSIDIDYKPLLVTLLEPSYRGNIYATENINEVKFSVQYILSEKELENNFLKVDLLNENAEELLEQLVVEKIKKREIYKLPIKGLKMGSYWLQVTLYNKKGEFISRKKLRINLLPSAENEWRVGKDGVLLHNGTSFLPVGYYNIPLEEIENNRNLYCNTVYLPVEDALSLEQTLAYLDALHAQGKYGVISPYLQEAIFTPSKNISGGLLPLSVVQNLKTNIEKLKNHPALMAWSLAFKPEFKMISKKRLHQIYSLICEEDPYHPCLIVTSTLESAQKYHKSTDLLMPWELKPSPLKNRFCLNKSNYFKCLLELDNCVSVWLGLQTSSASNNNFSAGTVPSFIELRNLFYYGVILGAKGFLWFDYKHSLNSSSLKKGIPYLMEEASKLKDVILEDNSLSRLKVETSNKHAIAYSFKKVNGYAYLVLLNLSNLDQKVTVHVPHFSTFNVLNIIGEDKKIKLLPRGQIKDSLAPFQVRIYSTCPDSITSKTLQDIETNIKLSNHFRKKEGNKAFEDNKIAIRASSNNENSYLDKIVDGFLKGLQWSSASGAPLPQWLELTFPKPINASKVLLYSDTIQKAHLEIFKDSRWQKQADFQKGEENAFEAHFNDCNFSLLRVIITEKKSDQKSVTLAEIEVY